MRSARGSSGIRSDRGGDERWSRILDAAADSFFEHGYGGSTIQDIARRAGMLKGSLYYYIETKEDLLYALVLREHDRGLAYLKEPSDIADSNADVRLRYFVLRWMERIASQLHWSVLVEREFRRLSPDRLAIVARKRRNYHAHLLGIIQQGIKSGVFASTIPPVVAVNTIFQMLNHTHLWYRDDGALGWAEVAEWYADFVTRGVLASSAALGPPRADSRVLAYVAELGQMIPSRKEKENSSAGLDRTASELVSVMSALTNRLGRHESNGDAHDPTTHSLLASLHHRPGRRPSDVAGDLDVSPQTITRRVQALVDQGLIDARAHERDGRSVRLFLTSSGAREYELQMERSIASCRWALEGWTADDARTLTDLLGRFISGLDG